MTTITINPPRPTIDKIFAGPMVTIKVDTNEKAYQIHKVLIMHYSGYFRGAFRSSFKEGEMDEVTLPDVDTATFEIFIDWLYQQKVCPEDNWGEIFDSGYSWAHSMALLYVFADRFLVAELKSLLMVTMIDEFNVSSAVPAYATIQFAAENLPERSSFVRLLIDRHCSAWEKEQDDPDEEEAFKKLPSEILYKMMMRFAHYRRETDYLLLSDYLAEDTGGAK